MGIAFVFPGQGSQYVGMGKELYEQFPSARFIFDQANEVLKYDLKKLCFQGPEDLLRETFYTQPAVLVCSLASFKIIKEERIIPSVMAGHSVGEYSALVATGVLDFPTGLKLVQKRGQLMGELSSLTKGTMAAIIGLSRDEVSEICLSLRNVGRVEPANYNSPGQVVISGEVDALEKALELAKERGASRTIRLEVSGPFHSSLMQPASEKLAKEIEGIIFNSPQVPIVLNVNAQYTSDPSQLKEALVRQVYSPVFWEDSVRIMISQGATVFIEVGPGKILSGLIRRIDKRVKVLNVEDRESLERTIKTLRV